MQPFWREFFRQCRRVFVALFKISKYILISTPNWSFLPSNYGRRNFRHLPHEQTAGDRACRLGEAAETGSKSTSWFVFFIFVHKLYQDLLTFQLINGSPS